MLMSTKRKKLKEKEAMNKIESECANKDACKDRIVW